MKPGAWARIATTQKCIKLLDLRDTLYEEKGLQALSFLESLESLAITSDSGCDLEFVHATILAQFSNRPLRLQMTANNIGTNRYWWSQNIEPIISRFSEEQWHTAGFLSPSLLVKKLWKKFRLLLLAVSEYSNERIPTSVLELIIREYSARKISISHCPTLEIPALGLTRWELNRF